MASNEYYLVFSHYTPACSHLPLIGLSLIWMMDGWIMNII